MGKKKYTAEDASGNEIDEVTYIAMLFINHDIIRHINEIRNLHLYDKIEMGRVFPDRSIELKKGDHRVVARYRRKNFDYWLKQLQAVNKKEVPSSGRCE